MTKKWKFVGDSPRIYGDLSLEVQPGDVHEFDEPPDGNWESVPAKTKTTDPTTEA